jgi:putative ABC transport system substrate-binding protein
MAALPRLARRAFIGSMAAFALSSPAAGLAQPRTSPYRIALLGQSSPALAGHFLTAFHKALKEHGWTEGRDVVIEARWAQGENSRLEPLARELLALKPHLVFAPTTSGALVVQRLTHDVPVVFALASDPVGDGLIASFARPGGNLTGLASIGAELAPKRLQLLKECVPHATRLAALLDPSVGYNVRSLDDVRKAAARVGMTLVATGNASQRTDFEGALAKITRKRPDAITVLDNPLFFAQRQALVDLINSTRIPAVYAIADFAAVGGLLSYAVDYVDQYRRAAGYVDRILRGANPAELPVQQPEKFRLIVNRKTARLCNVVVPQTVLLQADTLIE